MKKEGYHTYIYTELLGRQKCSNHSVCEKLESLCIMFKTKACDWSNS